MKPSTKPKQPRPKSVLLTDLQEAFVEHVLDGKTTTGAAIAAGYSGNPSTTRVLRPQAVRDAIAERREELSSATQIKRADVIAGITEAIDLARAAAEPATMIAGWREIGKMLGLYEPEKLKIELTAGQQAMRGRLEVLSDQELLQLAEGETIEGDFEHV